MRRLRNSGSDAVPVALAIAQLHETIRRSPVRSLRTIIRHSKGFEDGLPVASIGQAAALLETEA
jgi:hypothetical protein